VIIPWNRVSSVLNEAVVLPPPDTDLSSDILGRAQSAHILRTPAEWPRERPPPTSQPRVCKTRLSESDGCKASQVVTVVTEILLNSLSRKQSARRSEKEPGTISPPEYHKYSTYTHKNMH
jgi:hypothetical protein